MHQLAKRFCGKCPVANTDKLTSRRKIALMFCPPAIVAESYVKLPDYTKVTRRHCCTLFSPWKRTISK